MAVAGLLSAAILSAEIADAQTAPDSDPPAAPSTRIRPEDEPLVFFVAASESGVCGAGCNEWIAAEGRFDNGAPQRFRKFLAGLGNRRLPIYFNSPGGFVDPALEIGRIMRTRGMTASIGRTIPAGCDPRRGRRDPDCDKIKTAPGPVPSELRTRRVQCNSSCVYALIGAAERQIPPGALLGVHRGRVTDIKLNGRSLAAGSTRDRIEKVSMERMNGKLRQYIARMGVDPALFKAADEVPYENVRFLSRSEIVGFRIDPRKLLESPWMTGEASGGRTVVKKSFTESRSDERDDFRTTLLQIACTGPNQLNVYYGREMTKDDGRVVVPIKLLMGEAQVIFNPRRTAAVAGRNQLFYDNRAERVALAPLRAAANLEAILIVESPVTSDTAGHTTKIATGGFSAALDRLMSRCR